MPNEAQAPASRAERKKQLIAQGAAFRARVLHSRTDTHASLRPDLLAKGALGQVMTALRAVFKKGSGSGFAGINLQTALPLLVGGMSALSKRKAPLKPVIGGTLILAAAGAVTTLILKNRKAARTPR